MRKRLAVVAFMLATAAAARATPLAPDDFTARVRDVAARTTHATVTVEGPLLLAIRPRKGAPRRADLTRLHVSCFRMHGTCESLVLQFAQGLARDIARKPRRRT